MNPRLMVCFSGPVNPNTLQGGLSIVAKSGPNVSVDQVIYDSASNCAFAKPSQVLNQQSQYLLVVSNSIQDTTGQPVVADSAFTNCLASSTVSYCPPLAHALQTFHPVASNVVAASLFTTMSATSWLENARTSVTYATLPPVIVSPPFNVSDIADLTWVPQDFSGTTAAQQKIPVSALSGVGSVAFGAFFSLQFLSPLDGTIHTTPTTQPASPFYPIPVSFHVFQPASAKPKKGYPVVIYGHGLGDSQFGAPTYIASTLAQNGFATIGFEIPGHGYGPGSIVNVTTKDGNIQPIPTPGRGILLPGHSKIGAVDGCILPGAVAVRDCARQAAVDLVALVEAIKASPWLNLDPSRIYYVGQSFGGTYGTLFHAIEPDVEAAVLNGNGGSSVDVARLAITARPIAVGYLASLGLLNSPPAVHAPYFHDPFNDNYVFRGQPAVSNNIQGAMAIQAALEAADWLGMLGDPLSYAPHLQISPLKGVHAKSTLFQYAFGDLEVPNPTESAVIRAAGAQSTAWFFHFEVATLGVGHTELLGVTTPDAGGLPILPHRILSNPSIFAVPAETSIALAEQKQVAAFFGSDGKSNPDPNQYVSPPFVPGMGLFQVLGTNLPEQQNFIQLQP